MISPALRRFLPYLRPHARLLALTVVAAVVSLAAASTIPLLIKAVIDGPVAHRQPGQLLPYALAILLRMDWRLALISSLLVLPLGLLSRRFFRRYAAIARRVQDQQGDMTTVVEEMATGVRIIKAFGRNALLLGRFRREGAPAPNRVAAPSRSPPLIWRRRQLAPDQKKLQLWCRRAPVRSGREEPPLRVAGSHAGPHPAISPVQIRRQPGRATRNLQAARCACELRPG